MSLTDSSIRKNDVARHVSRFMYFLCVAFTCFILALLVLVIGYLIYSGAKSVSLSFFSELPWPKGSKAFPGGMANGLIGTVILIAMAAIVGVPLGMLGGVFLSEYGSNSKIAAPVRFVADVLTGVPSIVVGILGYELLVRRGFIHKPNGYAGAFALAFIMIPIIARTTEEMLRLVPQSYREASIALGASKARTILKVIIPSAAGSLITGIMLSLARVAGETAPLLFTAEGSRLWTFNPRHPFPSLTKQIFDNASSPYEEQKNLARAGILVLIAMIFIFNLSVRLMARSKHGNAS
jgi:phosphate transport system permease protein